MIQETPYVYFVLRGRIDGGEQFTFNDKGVPLYDGWYFHDAKNPERINGPYQSRRFVMSDLELYKKEPNSRQRWMG